MQARAEDLGERETIAAIQAGEYDDLEVVEVCSIIVIMFWRRGELVREIHAPKSNHVARCVHFICAKLDRGRVSQATTKFAQAPECV